MRRERRLRSEMGAGDGLDSTQLALETAQRDGLPHYHGRALRHDVRSIRGDEVPSRRGRLRDSVPRRLRKHLWMRAFDPSSTGSKTARSLLSRSSVQARRIDDDARRATRPISSDISPEGSRCACPQRDRPLDVPASGDATKCLKPDILAARVFRCLRRDRGGLLRRGRESEELSFDLSRPNTEGRHGTQAEKRRSDPSA